MKTVWYLLILILSAAPAMAENTIREFPDHVVVEVTGEQGEKQAVGAGGEADEQAERIAWLEGELGRLRREALTFRSGRPGDTPEDTQFRLSRRDELASEINRYNAELISLKKGQQTNVIGAEPQQ
jgi:hypothetical protein